LAKRVLVAGRFEDDVAAMAAVTTVRAAVGDEFFLPETHLAITAGTGLDEYFCLINEFMLF
jgi:hypothetical protein